jgi:hypothetical protein
VLKQWGAWRVLSLSGRESEPAVRTNLSEIC